MIVLKVIGWILLGILGLILAVLVLACIAMCFRVRLNVEYSDENTSVLLKYLFLKIPVYPRPKKDKAASDDKKDKKKKSENKEEKNKNKKEKNKKEEKKEDATVEVAVSEALPEEELQPDTTDTAAPDAAADEPAKAPAKKKNGIVDLLKTLYNAEGIDGLTLIARRSCDYFGTFFGGLLRGFVVDDFELDVRCSKSDAASTAIYYGEVCSTLFPLLASLAAKCKLKNHDINVYPDYLARYSSASFILDLYFTPIVMVGHVLALGVKFVFKVALQMVVKIFLYLKGNKNSTGNENKNLKEKSEMANE